MSKERKVVLTGIKPTGLPHIGNYFGAIEPALELAKDENYDARYFIADYHALNLIKDPKILKEYTYEVAATWLACGLNPEKVLLYKQSSVPETFELTTILSTFTAKGLMNRAHAYKASIAKNKENGVDIDSGINMGTYTYPILMAADILLFDTDIVPVGKDQVQHIEMATDIAQALNNNYGTDVLKIPVAKVGETTKTIVGMDGRKMSKSYNNTISLFLPEKQLRKTIMKIITNSQEIEESKDPDKCNVFTLYKLFANQGQQNALAERYLAGGMGYGHAKQELFEVANDYLKPIREKYIELMDNKDYIDKVLFDGGQKARIIASEVLDRVRKTVGIF